MPGGQASRRTCPGALAGRIGLRPSPGPSGASGPPDASEPPDASTILQAHVSPGVMHAARSPMVGWSSPAGTKTARQSIARDTAV